MPTWKLAVAIAVSWIRIHISRPALAPLRLRSEDDLLDRGTGMLFREAVPKQLHDVIWAANRLALWTA